MRHKITIVSLAVIALLLVYYALSNFTEHKPDVQRLKSEIKPASKIVNVYTSRKESLVKSIFDDFTSKTGIKVNYIVDDASKLIARIEHEQEATQADLFLTADITNLVLADKKGLLSPIESELIAGVIPESLRDKNWVALTKRTSVIVYAKNKVSPSELVSFEDLAAPKWHNRLVLRSSNSPYTQSMIAWFVHRLGETKTRSIVHSMVGNMVRKPHGGDIDQIRAVAVGEGDVTISNNYYLARIIASDLTEDKKIASKVGVFFPNQDTGGTFVNISGAGIAKFAQHPDSALKLLEFMAKITTQKIYADQNHEYPVVEQVKYSDILTSWGDYKIDIASLKNIPNYSDLAIQIADEEGWR